MPTVFDKTLIEFTLIKAGRLIEIYKLGGGTDGKRYSGHWGYRILHQGTTMAAGEDLYTGTPKTHHEAAGLVLDIHMATREEEVV